MTTKSDTTIFKEACNGYGFVEVPQRADGIYCDGCCVVHKRPTKMYTNRQGGSGNLCRHQVVRLYNPKEQS